METMIDPPGTNSVLSSATDRVRRDPLEALSPVRNRAAGPEDLPLPRQVKQRVNLGMAGGWDVTALSGGDSMLRRSITTCETGADSLLSS
jgi:hypothetical protein